MSGSCAQCRQTLKSFPTQHSGLNQHKSRSKSAPAPMLNHKLAIWCSQRTRRFPRGWEQHYWLWMTDTAPQHLHPSRNEAEPLGKHLFCAKASKNEAQLHLHEGFNSNNPHRTHLRSIWRCSTHQSLASSSFSLAVAAGLYCTKHNFARRVSFTELFYSSERHVTAIF